jgi:hypothetical protein
MSADIPGKQVVDGKLASFRAKRWGRWDGPGYREGGKRCAILKGFTPERSASQSLRHHWRGVYSQNTEAFTPGPRDRSGGLGELTDASPRGCGPSNSPPAHVALFCHPRGMLVAADLATDAPPRLVQSLNVPLNVTARVTVRTPHPYCTYTFLFVKLFRR